jgi:hypothetical protein
MILPFLHAALCQKESQRTLQRDRSLDHAKTLDSCHELLEHSYQFMSSHVNPVFEHETRNFFNQIEGMSDTSLEIF